MHPVRLPFLWKPALRRLPGACHPPGTLFITLCVSLGRILPHHFPCEFPSPTLCHQTVWFFEARNYFKHLYTPSAFILVSTMGILYMFRWVREWKLRNFLRYVGSNGALLGLATGGQWISLLILAHLARSSLSPKGWRWSTITHSADIYWELHRARHCSRPCRYDRKQSRQKSLPFTSRYLFKENESP